MSVESIPSLSEKLIQAGIQGALVDLDDTIVNTSALFTAKIEQFAAFAIPHTGHPSPELFAENTFRPLSADVFRTHFVRPDRWDPVFDMLRKKYPNVPEEIMRYGRQLLAEVYQTAPSIKAGAMEMLAAFRAANLSITIVTHANEAWTHLKLRETGLDNWCDHLVIADENRHKSQTDWEAALSLAGLEGKNAVVIGDNLNGDINAAYAAGVRHGVYIEAGWKFYSMGELPSGVFVANDTVNVLDALYEGL